MISSLVEFEEATAFERWALEGLVPVPSSLPHTAVKNMEKNEVRVMGATAVVRVYAGGVREVHVDLRPLAFGAAWKVLDLLVELALAQADHFPRSRLTSKRPSVGPFSVLLRQRSKESSRLGSAPTLHGT